MIERDRMDRRLAADLEAVLAAQIEQDASRALPNAIRPTAHGRRSLWVTAVVGVVVAVLAIAAIQAAALRPDHGLPAATASSSSTNPDRGLLSRLPEIQYGTVVHTWTDQRPDGSGPFAVTGSTVVIAAVCRGGGAITVHDAGGKPHRRVCDREVTQQPFWRSSGLAGEDAAVEVGPVRASVTVESGHPQFAVRMWEVDPRVLRSTMRVGVRSDAVPVSLRTCVRGDLASSGSLDAEADENSGLVTITNRSSSDCAIRSWPAMSYLDRSGARVGPIQGGADINGRSLDSREGAVDRFQEFPPARLVAGGHGYLIVDLYTRGRLDDDDRTARAAAKRASTGPSTAPSQLPMAPPLCHPVTVTTLRLVVSGSTIIVPVPSSPARAACAAGSIAFGVNPVVTKNPVVG